MKRQKILLATFLNTAMCFGVTGAVYAADDITTNTINTAQESDSQMARDNPRVAAQNFVAHVNYARVALSMKNGELAMQHIRHARNMVAIILNAKTEQRTILNVEAGRVNYAFNTVHKYNYFPVVAGWTEVKEVTDGPLWAKDSLAVSDAEIVLLTLDLTNDKAETYLAAAESAINSGKLADAQEKLGELTDAVVKVEDKVSNPVSRAHDNIGIAKSFILAKNYDGARFALSHAADALDEMQKDDVYKARRDGIVAMRKEVSDLNVIIVKKDPSLLDNTSKQLEKWMSELKQWASK